MHAAISQQLLHNWSCCICLVTGAVGWQVSLQLYHHWLHWTDGVHLFAGQAVVIKQASRRLGEATAVRVGCALLALSLLGIGFSQQLWQLLLWLFPSAVATVLVVTINAARLTKVRRRPAQGAAALLYYSSVMSTSEGCFDRIAKRVELRAK
jgi:hypothetical protein